MHRASSITSIARRGLIGLCAVPALIIAGSTTASAHGFYVYQGSDLATLNGSHNYVTACDRENDGNAVYADFIMTGGVRDKVWDSYDNECQARYTNLVTQIRVCEQVAGAADYCSEWRNA